MGKRSATPQSEVLMINRLDSISHGECFTRDSDATFPLDVQIASDETQMSSVRNKQVWSKNERKREEISIQTDFLAVFGTFN